MPATATAADAAAVFRARGNNAAAEAINAANPRLRDSRNADFIANPAIYLASLNKTIRVLDMFFSQGYYAVNTPGKIHVRELFDLGVEDLEIYHALQYHHLSPTR